MQTKILLTIGTFFICASAALGTDSSVPHIKADQVHALGFDGSGVTVAVIDTGIDYSHPGLVGHIRPGGRSYEGGDLQGDPGDDVYGDGHGTYMSLIIADASGVAPGADILPIRVFGPLGAFDEDILRGIEYITQRQEADPSIRVINLSLGGGQSPCQCDNDSDATRKFQAAILDALNAGIVTFAATGNDADCGWISEPACVSAANKVAASYDGGYPTQDFYDGNGVYVCSDFLPQAYRVTCFSHIADDCDYFLAAPGFEISLWEGWGPPLEFGGDGTSQATAHASGVAALMFSKLGCGSLSGLAARALMFNTADEYWWQYPYCALPPPPRHVNALGAVNAVSTGTSAIPGDMDCDGHVSLYDYELFASCMTGPDGGPVQGFCTSGDFPTSPPDGDIDLRDFAGFQRAFTGYGSGACCHNDGTCTIEDVAACVAEWGTTYYGHDTTCTQVQCALPDHGACCQVSGTSCSEETHVNCGFGDGLYMGDGTLCSSTPCPTVRYRNVVDPLPGYEAAGSGLALADDITLSGTGGGEMVYYDLNVYGGTGGGGFFDVTVGLYNNFPGDGGILIGGTQRTFTNLPVNGSPVFISATFAPAISVPQQFWMVASFSTSQAGWFIAEAAETGFTGDYFGSYVPPWSLYWYGGNPYAGFWANVGVTDQGGLAGFAASADSSADPPDETQDAQLTDYHPAEAETFIESPGDWSVENAEVTFEVRPVGGHYPATVLLANSEYELHYRAESDAVHFYILVAVGDSLEVGLEAAEPPSAGDWAGTGNFIWADARKDADAPVPAIGYDEGYYFLNLAADTGLSGPEGHSVSFTTGSAGELFLDLLMWWDDEDARSSVLMQARKRYIVENK